MANKDIISLQGLEFYAFHGVMEEEKKLGQRFVVDIDLHTDLSKAGLSDCVNDTINYAQVYETIKKIVENERFNLLEGLAEKLCQDVLRQYPCDAVKVKIHKPQAPIQGIFSDVSVSIYREKHWHKAYLSLGSNLGKRGYNLKEALRRLNNHPQIIVDKESHIYETEPWGVENQPDYWNMAVEIRTALEPLELLNVCLNIEENLGRVRKERWESRPIDIDLLLYDNKCIDLPNLTIPHPRMKERAFVLIPLQEIGLERLPSGELINELISKLKGGERVELI